MEILNSFRMRLAYKREFKKSLDEQKIKIDPKVVNKCVDIAMAMNNIYILVNDGRTLKVDEDSLNYINNFANVNVAVLVKTLNTAEQVDNSYIG